MKLEKMWSEDLDQKRALIKFWKEKIMKEGNGSWQTEVGGE